MSKAVASYCHRSSYAQFVYNFAHVLVFCFVFARCDAMRCGRFESAHNDDHSNRIWYDDETWEAENPFNSINGARTQCVKLVAQIISFNLQFACLSLSTATKWIAWFDQILNNALRPINYNLKSSTHYSRSNVAKQNLSKIYSEKKKMENKQLPNTKKKNSNCK